jgi:hypothetical protein
MQRVVLHQERAVDQFPDLARGGWRRDLYRPSSFGRCRDAPSATPQIRVIRLSPSLNPRGSAPGNGLYRALAIKKLDLAVAFQPRPDRS